MLLFPVMYGTEYALLPFLSMLYLRYMTDFTWCGIFINNCVVTLFSAGLAYHRSSAIARQIGVRNARGRTEPVWPALVAVMLTFLAGLQMILSVTHWSYYRKLDLFDAFER